MRQRIESCTAAFHHRRLELLRDLPGNRCGVELRSFSDGIIATAAARVPDIDWMQHVMGLSPGHEHIVPEIAAWYAELGTRPRFEIAPADRFEQLAAALAGIGARQHAFIDTLWARAAVPDDDPPAGVDVRVVDASADDAALFARVHLGGHEVPDEALTEHWAAVGLWTSEPGWTCYLASVDGEALGAAALAVSDGIGYLANASTLPHGRGRGCQQALIHRRLRDAVAAGCELVVTLAIPGKTSHRNLERGGLGVAYTKVFWAVTT